MRDMLILVVGLLFMVDGFDARTVLRKHKLDELSDVEFSKRSRHNILSQCFVDAMAESREKCGIMREITADKFDAYFDDEIIEKLPQVDIGQLCSPFAQWIRCVNTTFSACAVSDNPFVVQNQRSINAFDAAIQFICYEDENVLSVINQHKACLLRGDKDSEPGVVPLYQKSVDVCRQHIDDSEMQSEPFCYPSGFLACAKDVVAEQCGDEIASTLHALAARLRSAVGCPAFHLRSAAHMKRRGFPSYSHTFDFLKSFF